jgi:uncharacterized membrane protein
MADSPSRELGSPSSGNSVPFDLVLVVILTLATLAVSLTSAGTSALQVALGILFVFFVPGYALVAALFPATDGDEYDGIEFISSRFGGRLSDITGAERFVLSVGLSLALVPLIGLVLNFTPGGIHSASAHIAVALVTVLLAIVGAVRRWQLPAHRRFHLPVRDSVTQGGSWVSSGSSWTESLLNVALVIAVVLAATGAVYAIAVPKEGETYTEFYLMTKDPKSGELVADNYPQQLTRGQQQTMFVGITNQEHQEMSYTVVVEIQRVRTSGEQATVLEESELHQFRTTLGHNESWRKKHAIQPTIAGDRLRLTYLLYTGPPPANPSVDNAYRTLHVWFDVSTGSGSQGSLAEPTEPTEPSSGTQASVTEPTSTAGSTQATVAEPAALTAPTASTDAYPTAI